MADKSFKSSAHYIQPFIPREREYQAGTETGLQSPTPYEFSATALEFNGELATKSAAVYIRFLVTRDGLS